MSGIPCDRERGEDVVASAGTGEENPGQNQDGVDRSGKRRFGKIPKGLRFSLRATLLLTTLLCICVGHVSNTTIRDLRAIEFLEGPDIGGRVKSYRATWYANLIPQWLQNEIGEKYFRTPTAIDLGIRLTTTDSDDAVADPLNLHNAQQVFESLSRFKQLELLVLRLTQLDSLAKDNDPTGKIDVSSVKDLKVRRIELHGSNRLAADLVGQMQVDCLSICQCEVTEPLLNSIIGNRHIHTVNFQQARILADKLLKFGEMKNLRSIQFSECRPVKNEFGTFHILSDPAPGSSWIAIGVKANDWLKLNLPQISITGLGP